MSATLIPVVGSGPIAVVGAHGFTQTGGMWREVAELARLGIVVPDLPGHGSAWPGRVDWDAAVGAITDVLGPKPTVLAGYSQGGRVALAAAMAAPESVRHLVLISARPGVADDGARAERRERDEALALEIEAEGVGAFVDRWLASPMFAGLVRRPAEWRERDRLMRLANTPEGLAAALRGYGLGAMPYLGSRLETLKVPVTLVAGEDDPRLVEEAAAMAARLPAATLRVIAGSGHAVVGEAPGRIAEILTNVAR